MNAPGSRRFWTLGRVWMVSAIAVIAFWGLVLGLADWRRRTLAEAERRRVAEVAQAREQRQTPVAEVAPAPMPVARPFVGRAGVDADGYPLEFVDAPALRSLLKHGRYEELTRWFEEFQTAFEADPFKEYWPTDAAEAFGTSEPELRPMLDAWVAATPDSFAPYFARGTHWSSVAFTRRGVRWVKDTPKEDLAAMEEAFVPANADLKKALELRPKLVGAMREQLHIRGASRTSTDDAEKIADRASKACPTCFLFRATRMNYLTPRWGGTYAKMAAYAKHAPVEKNRRLRLLPGYIELDRANVAWREKKLDDALAAANRACALGDLATFFAERAEIHRAREDYGQSLEDLNRALTLRPGYSKFLFERMKTHDYRRDWEAGARDLLEGLKADPANRDAREYLPRMVQGLTYEGRKHVDAGRREDALRLLDLAVELAPNDANAQRTRSYAISPSKGGVAVGPDIATLEERARNAPDDFRAQQELDYALARERKFDRVIEIWTAYLARHPDDGRAYLERAGAAHNKHDLALAKSDATRACELGVNQGCAHAKEFARRSR